MPTIVVYHDLPIAEALGGKRSGLSVVDAESADAVSQQLPEADGLVTNPTSWTDDFLEHLSPGDWVQTTSAGYAAFPLAGFEANGVTFTNAAGNYGPVVSEHAFALALALSRDLPAFLDRQRRRVWDREDATALFDWHDKRLTVLGIGNIGEHVARRGLAFGMDVYGVKRDPASYDGCLDQDRIVGGGFFHDVLPETDLLVVSVPLTKETEHMVDEYVLRELPSSAILVNVARGPVVDEQAIVRALEEGEIAGAGLDVFATEPLPEDSPLWEREDAILTPHVGGRSESFVDRFVDTFLENYDRWVEGRSLKNRIGPSD